MSDEKRKILYAVLGILPLVVVALLLFQKCSDRAEDIPEIIENIDTLVAGPDGAATSSYEHADSTVVSDMTTVSEIADASLETPATSSTAVLTATGTPAATANNASSAASANDDLAATAPLTQRAADSMDSGSTGSDSLNPDSIVTDSSVADSLTTGSPVLDPTVADSSAVGASDTEDNSSNVAPGTADSVVAQADSTAIVSDSTVLASAVAPMDSLATPDMQISLKTNLLGWGMGISNVAVEFDLAEHWSFHLPVYYSAWNYFKSTIKFRTLATQPEIRYWFSEDNENFFLGAHFGMAYYNLAVGGNYRYQDHNKNTPSLGGGLSVGYRMPVCKSKNWKLEFSLGAGGYSVFCDRFHNTPDVSKGLMVDNLKTTYWGIDNASVSFLYSFGIHKKGGRK